MIFPLGSMVLRQRARLRSLIRGYTQIKRQGRIGDLRTIRNSLVDVEVAKTEVEQSTFFFGVASNRVEMMARQFVLERYAGAALNRAVIYSKAHADQRVSCPIPSAWVACLEANHVRVNTGRTALVWALEILKRYAHGIVMLARLVRQNLQSVTCLEDALAPDSVYFDGLAHGNIPSPTSVADGYDMCSWFVRWNERSGAVISSVGHGVALAPDTVVNGVAVRFVRPPYEQLNRYRDVVVLGLWGIGAVLLAGMDLLRGRWCKALLLSEAVKAKAVQLAPPERVAREYWFHFSGNVFRPMWTYEVERQGASVALYFYSTCAQIKLPSGYTSQRFEWGPATWPRYIVWDRDQAALLRRDLGPDIQIVIVGAIHYTDSVLALPEIPGVGIAVFDVQPPRRSVHFGISTLADYWGVYPDLHIRFLRDVRSVLAEYGAQMVVKGKRDIGRRGEKRYAKLMHEFAEATEVSVVDPGVAAIRVIQKCYAGISIPFTSTALYAREQGLPSIYYDPVGWIQKDDLGAHGIPIVSGKDELRVWVKQVMASTEKVA